MQQPFQITGRPASRASTSSRSRSTAAQPRPRRLLRHRRLGVLGRHQVRLGRPDLLSLDARPQRRARRPSASVPRLLVHALLRPHSGPRHQRAVQLDRSRPHGVHPRRHSPGSPPVVWTSPTSPAPTATTRRSSSQARFVNTTQVILPRPIRPTPATPSRRSPIRQQRSTSRCQLFPTSPAPRPPRRTWPPSSP